MYIQRNHLLTAVLLSFVLLHGCGKEGPSPVDPSSNTGNLKVVVITSGEDQDSDGYTIFIDGGQSSRTSNSNDNLNFPNLEEGPHNVELVGYSSNCEVKAENPRKVQIITQQTTLTTFEIICEILPPAEIQVASGNDQKGLVGKPLSEVLVVRAIKQNNKPAIGIPVTWNIITGNGRIEKLDATTDIDGFARAIWTLGTAEGLNKTEARIENLEPVSFTATGFKTALSLNCLPDVLDVPQNASSTLVCSLNSIIELNGLVSLKTSPTGGDISAYVQPQEAEVPVSDTLTFLVGASVSESAPLGTQTVHITAKNGEQEATVDLPLEVVSSRPTVNVIYLVPTDRTNRSDYSNAMELASRHLQIWFYQNFKSGITFNLANPVVQVIPTSHDAEWYTTNNLDMDESLWFWYNVVYDGFSLTGGQFNDKDHIWIFYIEAEPACGQVGGAGTSGVAVLPANDPRGLVGEQMIPYCPDETLDNRPPCGWVGGLGHELGHALGLPHPPDCNQGGANCDYDALMWGGFRNYPETYLRNDEKQYLNTSPFFSSLSVPAKNFSCNSFGALGSTN